MLNNLAYERLTRGHVSEAEELLARIPARLQTKGALARAVGVQRAMIALYRGDAEAAVAAATTATSRPYEFLDRDRQRMQDASAYALRALAHASLGREAEARADADRVDRSDMTTPEAIARAALARALVVSRTEGASGLARYFAAGALRDNRVPVAAGARPRPCAAADGPCLTAARLPRTGKDG